MYLQNTQTMNVSFAERTRVRRTGWLLALAFVALHVPLALLMRQFSPLATAHAFAVLAAGLGLAVLGRRPMQVGYVGAYIVGAEVLWRMSDAAVFWEFGKYAIIVIFVVALLRAPRLRLPGLPFVYFALLLPAVALTFTQLSLKDAQQQISFNLSGPLALFVAAWFFSHIKLDGAQLGKIFVALIAPLTGIACVTLYGTLTAANLRFAGEANDVTSGGFGPNQVSAMLGLGALVAFWFLLNEKVQLQQRFLMFGLLLFFSVQSAMTFSRGGLYNAGGACLLAALYLARDVRARLRLLMIVALTVALGYYLIVPGLDAFTGGTLLERFQDTSLTGRDLLIRADLQIWMEHPLLGVGPGVSAIMHEAFFREAAAHTEYTRLLAEHGALGLAAMLVLAAMLLGNLRRARTRRGKALVVLLAGWSLLFMSNVAMRMVAPSFLIGLTFAALLPDE
ncbi:MAG TPA: O-antigen ligase family protein [Pyrinomonadaceae bacterium]|nr:O-antigen ligase family protein [Pyrinomonadaceae bacterium]